MDLQIFSTIKKMRFKNTYIMFAILYGISTLIVPLAVQFLVNNLILTGLWQSMVTFTIIIAMSLTLAQIFRHSLTIISESIERDLFDQFADQIDFSKAENKIYITELFHSLKSFTKLFSDAIEILLATIFGMMTIFLFHPGFIILPFICFFALRLIWQKNRDAIKTSISESNEKYEFINLSGELSDEKKIYYLTSRNDHFSYVKRNSLIVSGLFILTQILLIGIGTYFVQTNSLSIGQLVSAEIIISGIFASLLKVPKSMEAFYDYETSMYKFKKVMK